MPDGGFGGFGWFWLVLVGFGWFWWFWLVMVGLAWFSLVLVDFGKV